MRKAPEPRFVTVNVPDSDTLEGCRITVQTNIPVRVFKEFEDLMQIGAVSSTVQFLLRVVNVWEGFDLPLTEEGLGQLTSQELNALTECAMGAIRNP